LVAQRDLELGHDIREQRVELGAVALGKLVIRIPRVVPVDLPIVKLVEPRQAAYDISVETPETELGGMTVDKQRCEPVVTMP